MYFLAFHHLNVVCLFRPNAADTHARDQKELINGKCWQPIMCIFSGKVKNVSSTQIFARLDGKRQYIVYTMSIQSERDVAMILPIPIEVVSGGNNEDAVDFVNLEGYPNLFEHLAAGFVKNRLLSSRSRSANLKVHEVGKYIASFVPSIQDFDRLAEGFRLKADVWNEMQEYKDWGFAVFQLKTPGKDKVDFHPFAFSFPTRFQDRVYFPTKHLHDGTVPTSCRFDHVLYLQGTEPEVGWSKSHGPARDFVNLSISKGVFDGNLNYCRKEMRGVFINSDVYF